MRSVIFLLWTTLLFSGDLYVDKTNQIMWQDNADCRYKTMTWHDAKRYCMDLELGGYDDWWLPGESQLSTLIDPARPRGRRIIKELNHFAPDGYWSATTYAWNAPFAWVVDFQDGYSRSVEKLRLYHVRCFRRP